MDASVQDASLDAEVPAFDAAVADAAPPIKPDAGPPPCDDPADFGGREAARELPAITDKTDVQTRRDVLDGPTDVDRFSVYSDDLSSGLFPSPYAELTAGQAGLKICTYFSCTTKAFDSDPDCPAGSTASTDPAGTALGCCFTSSSAGQKVKIKYDCDSADDDVTLVMDVSSAAAMCTAYSFQYRTGD